MLRAYPHEATVDAGGSLRLHVAGDAPRFSVQIERWSDGAEIVHEAGPFACEDAPPGAVDAPWDWPALDVALPRDLAPGAYVARLCAAGGSHARGAPLDSTPDARWGTVLFCVRAPSRARILVSLALFTYQAYNVADTDWFAAGDQGACLYTGTRQVAALRRPGGGTGGHVWDQFHTDVYDGASPRQTFAHWDWAALRWLAREGIAVDVCTDLDLHRAAIDRDRYALLCSFGHDEYWTREKRANVERFVEAGGNLALFSGNTCYRRIRYDERTSVMTREGQWDDDPETAITGLTWSRGGGKWDGARPPAGYRIERADHPLLRGTGVRDGDEIAAWTALIGYEFDGIDDEHTPEGLVVLGRAAPIEWDVGDGGKLWPGCNAAMVTFRRGDGTVFNGGTTDWPRALAWGDPAIDAITRSVVRTLG